MHTYPNLKPSPTQRAHDANTNSGACRKRLTRVLTSNKSGGRKRSTGDGRFSKHMQRVPFWSFLSCQIRQSTSGQNHLWLISVSKHALATVRSTSDMHGARMPTSPSSCKVPVLACVHFACVHFPTLASAKSEPKPGPCLFHRHAHAAVISTVTCCPGQLAPPPRLGFIPIAKACDLHE